MSPACCGGTTREEQVHAGQGWSERPAMGHGEPRAQCEPGRHTG